MLASFVAGPEAGVQALTADAEALKALDRPEDALAAFGRARDAAPESGVAEHNLAGLLGDLQRYDESEAAVSRAFDKGLDAPETWLVHARALTALGDLDGAANPSARRSVAGRPIPTPWPNRLS